MWNQEKFYVIGPRREVFVQELQKYLPVSIFGACGTPIVQKPNNGNKLACFVP